MTVQQNKETGFTDKDEIGIADEIGEEISVNMKAQLDSEKTLWEQQLVKADKAIANYEEQWLVEKRLWEIKLEGDNLMPINPTTKVELLPEWWDLQKKMAEYKKREVLHMGDRKLEELKDQKEQIEKNLANVIDALAKVE